eukprot:SAG11_NODE_806_length_7093_cov_1.965379_6_plen_105_part_00
MGAQRDQLWKVFTLKMVIGQAKEILMPAIMHHCKKQGLKKQAHSNMKLKQWEKETVKDTPGDIADEYEEMAIQFGFMVLFAVGCAMRINWYCVAPGTVPINSQL